MAREMTPELKRALPNMATISAGSGIVQEKSHPKNANKKPTIMRMMENAFIDDVPAY